jgi:hypothetical protein
MKRRTFVSTLAALVATPALPTPTALAVPADHISKHFAKAKLLARCHDRASPEMFVRLMKLDSKTAESLFNLLKERSVIAPGIDGIARAINPLNTHCVPNEAIRARDLAQITRDLTTRLQETTRRRLKETNTDKVMNNHPSDNTVKNETTIQETATDAGSPNS